VGDSLFAMSEHDEDIDFDFFGEPEPASPKRQRLVRRPSGPPPGGPPRSGRPSGPAPPATPIVRLVSLVAFAIAAILILIFAVRSCESSNESAAYKNYMASAGTIATDSQSVGKQLTDLLASQDLTEKTVESKLTLLIGHQTIDIQKASKLEPPGPLRQQQDRLLEALQLRQNALTGLLAVFKGTASKKGTEAEMNTAGQLLSKQMLRGLASDVVWTDMFQSPSRTILQKEGIAGVSPPASVFIADPQYATTNSMSSDWQRIHGVQTSSTTTGGRHGTGISDVKVGGQTLTPGVTATIKDTGSITFVVGVNNGGDYLEQNVRVTLVINQRQQPIKIPQTIGQILSQTTKEVVFKIGAGTKYSLTDLINVVPIKVAIDPVPGETYLANNQVTYEVRFTL
jgi:hypothetical protein